MKRNFFMSLALSISILLTSGTLPTAKVHAEEIQSLPTEISSESGLTTLTVMAVVKEVIDTDLHKKLVLDRQDNTTYTLEVNKIPDSTYYTWSMELTQNMEVLSNQELTVQSFSENFSMDSLTQIVQMNDHEQISNYIESNVVFKEEEQTASSQRRAIPVIAVAVAGLSSSTIASLNIAINAATVAAIATAITNVYNDKKSTSTLSFPSGSQVDAKYDDFANYPTDFQRDAANHFELSLVKTIADMFRNNNNDGYSNLEIFATSTKGSDLGASIMTVATIGKDLYGIGNRHLGNKMGRSWANKNYADERLNLKGYTVYMVYNHQSKKIFHFHAVPSENRTVETMHMRYNYNYDLQIFPKYQQTKFYLEPPSDSPQRQQWEQTRLTHARNRNEKLEIEIGGVGKRAVIPKKNP
ncbi:hypothetical protein M3223_18655 [Paenibacillus pasadenensis]|uniref:hypothetical protein n=1 Tax=Paenibacillus pasadenensis TaxID=217090 RepID=UPI00203EA58D|nr:hypothetical protein [Paenibacillus pasadenensis]MCM3749376.1 hypothetical protein [Paenibacillus pasadenensis]